MTGLFRNELKALSYLSIEWKVTSQIGQALDMWYLRFDLRGALKHISCLSEIRPFPNYEFVTLLYIVGKPLLLSFQTKFSKAFNPMLVTRSNDFSVKTGIWLKRGFVGSMEPEPETGLVYNQRLVVSTQ